MTGTCAAACLLAAAGWAAETAETSDPERALRLLATHCVACHGPSRADSGIRLDRLFDIALVITPRKPDSSHLLRVILLPDGSPLRMPPKGSPRLEPADIEMLRRWILAGADGPPLTR